ncbi:hypothetical protein OUZ56_005649 [Daphnia magna]|uniref:Uncharacterized protein n=1 Tax=Daphnia magna TaxID=35525 RepID=A0ABQ9YTC7_9CRUS|nr:hypothetical protein OUZ56_005649 [Daphnia magna]
MSAHKKLGRAILNRTRMALQPCILNIGSTADTWMPQRCCNSCCLPPIADVVANKEENESVCVNMTNEEVQSSIYTNGCHAEAVIPDASRYSS